MNEVVDLIDKLSTFDETWSPRIVARYNNNDVMVVKVEGEFVWHDHPDTDDLFYVLDGNLDIEMRDRTVHLAAGQMFVVPAGAEHRPVARGRASVMIIEPAGTPNTGDPETATRKVEV